MLHVKIREQNLINDCLFFKYNLNNNIQGIILRIYLHKTAFSTDVEKADYNKIIIKSIVFQICAKIYYLNRLISLFIIKFFNARSLGDIRLIGILDYQII